MVGCGSIVLRAPCSTTTPQWLAVAAGGGGARAPAGRAGAPRRGRLRPQKGGGWGVPPPPPPNPPTHPPAHPPTSMALASGCSRSFVDSLMRMISASLTRAAARARAMAAVASARGGLQRRKFDARHAWHGHDLPPRARGPSYRLGDCRGTHAAAWSGVRGAGERTEANRRAGLLGRRRGSPAAQVGKPHPWTYLSDGREGRRQRVWQGRFVESASLDPSSQPRPGKMGSQKKWSARAGPRAGKQVWRVPGSCPRPKTHPGGQ